MIMLPVCELCDLAILLWELERQERVQDREQLANDLILLLELAALLGTPTTSRTTMCILDGYCKIRMSSRRYKQSLPSTKGLKLSGP